MEADSRTSKKLLFKADAEVSSNIGDNEFELSAFRPKESRPIHFDPLKVKS